MDPDARKGRVAAVALGRLRACGSALTTPDDVARAAGLGEAEIEAVFGDIEGLVGELLSPLLARLREIAAAAAASDVRRRQVLRDVLEAYLDALVAHRVLLGFVLADPPATTSASVRHVREAMAGVRDELARGTGSGLDGRIRATSALGAVQAAVSELVDFDATTVRVVITDAAVAILLP